jgi:two-component system, chemotaxis family, chemotaxis protein CheY
MAKILVADDSNYARRVLRQTLERAGHTVVEASSGMSALESLFLEKPDLLLLDLTMDDMGGLEVLHELSQAGNSVPVIVISADVQASTAGLVQNAGALRFLGKPVEEAVLLKAVRDAAGVE